MPCYNTEPTVFDKITEPAVSLIGEEADKIEGDAGKYTVVPPLHRQYIIWDYYGH